MQTDDLISLLSASNRPVDTGWLRRATWLAALGGLVLTTLVVASALGVRHDLSDVMMTAPVAAKFAFGISVTAIALVLFQRSLRPGAKARKLLPLMALPLAVVIAWAGLTLLQAPTGQWSTLTFGRNWRGCLVNVPLLSLGPLIVLSLLARRGAPVDGPLTGLAAGLASAGLATVSYALHCPDDTIPFLATWYTLALAIAATFSTLVLPRLLRW